METEFAPKNIVGVGKLSSLANLQGEGGRKEAGDGGMCSYASSSDADEMAPLVDSKRQPRWKNVSLFASDMQLW
jgi:hypothetical protein